MLTQKKNGPKANDFQQRQRERESKWENRAKQDNKTTGGTTNVT